MDADSSFWDRCPLAAKLHFFLGSFDDSQYEGYGHDMEHNAYDIWRREKGKSNLDLFIETIETSHSLALAFKASLSHSQLTSWCVIEEWLRGSYQPEPCATLAWDTIKDDEFLPSQWTQTVYEIATGHKLRPRSCYQFYLFDSYVHEFVPFKPSWTPQYAEESLTHLETVRQRAFQHALCQRLAHRMYIKKASGISNDGPPLTSSPRAIAPWLPKDVGRDEMPYYLWDSAERKTIIANTLADKPPYCCISHTWGRWRTKGLIRVSGLPWWKVPSNSIFLVQRLPAILSDFADRMGIRYVWFDLLCIPQDDCTPDLASRAKDEISRQAVIFRNATHCAAWVNYVDDWTAERAALDYISGTYLGSTTISTYYRPDILDPWIKTAFEDAESPAQLNYHPFNQKYLKRPRVPLFKRIRSLIRPSSRMTERYSQNFNHPKDWDLPSAWFSSLWTLQEAHLRPDMIIMNRRWEPLTNSSGDSYTLEMLFMSLETLWVLTGNLPQDRSPESSSTLLQRVDTTWEVRPMGVVQLHNLLFGTQLLTDATQTHVLIQANARQCTARRAEAIMSVLGATEWYQHASTDDELVLGMYPLAFVEEVRRKSGADFFLAQKRVGDPEAADDYYDGSAHGSMLPFETLDPVRLCGKADVKMYPYRAIDSQVHSSTQTWTLEITGSFRISRAAVLASSEDDSPAFRPAEVVLSYEIFPAQVTHSGSVEIKQWLMQQSKMFVTYAVQISRELGVILQGFRHHLGVLPPPIRLVKVGCYQVVDLWEREPDGADWISQQPSDWVPAQDVNWIVL